MKKALKFYFNSLIDEGLINLSIRIFHRFKNKDYYLAQQNNSKFLIRHNSADLNLYLQTFKQHLYKLNGIEQLKTIFDIGAYNGTTTRYFAQNAPNSTIHAFEPGISTFKALKYNLKSFPNVKLVQAALHSTAKILEIGSDTNFDLGGSIVSKLNREKVEEVKCLNINKYCKDQNIQNIDLLKVNIEGGEIDLFNTIDESLIKNIKIIFVDLHDRKVSGCSKALFDRLTSYNYDIEIRKHFLIVYKK